jgi:hypothetical protein
LSTNLTRKGGDEVGRRDGRDTLSDEQCRAEPRAGDARCRALQVHAVTETRLLPERTRLLIDFLKARLRER